MYEWTIENCYENFQEKKESQEIYEEIILKLLTLFPLKFSNFSFETTTSHK